MKPPVVLSYTDRMYIVIVTDLGERYSFTFGNNLQEISNTIEIICDYVDEPDLAFSENEARVMIDVIENVTGINHFLLKTGYYGSRYSF